MPEPECLVPPQTRWYRPGFGLICRQVMLPLFIAVLLLFVFMVQILLRRLGVEGLQLPAWIYAGGALLCILRGIYMVRVTLIHPIARVHDWVSQVSDGDMRARITEPGTGDFEGLIRDINALGQRMLELHEGLEEQVAEQTRSLEQKTQSLELLYEVVTSSTRFDTVEALLSHFMSRFGEVFRARAAVIRILARGRLELVDSHGLEPDSPWLAGPVTLREMLRRRSREEGRNAADLKDVEFERLEDDREDSARAMFVATIPMLCRGTYLGYLQLFLHDGETVNEDTRKMFLNVGQHLGVMIEQSRLDDESERLFTVEARARLANELHDSLAQTLASLRIQVRVLDETLHQGEEQVTWEELEKLETQVEEAISELRSLIGQFRAPYQSQEVAGSVAKLVERCRDDTSLSVFLQNEWQDDTLTPAMRADVIRIVQEALTNVRKHADADTVRVLLRHRDGSFRIVVEDDGIGYDENRLPGAAAPGEHIGRQIMAERAERLGADLKLESEPGEGSRVTLEFECRDGRTVTEAGAE